MLDNKTLFFLIRIIRDRKGRDATIQYNQFHHVKSFTNNPKGALHSFDNNPKYIPNGIVSFVTFIYEICLLKCWEICILSMF